MTVHHDPIEPSALGSPLWKYGFGAVALSLFLTETLRGWHVGRLISHPTSALLLLILCANHWYTAFLSPSEQRSIRIRHAVVIGGCLAFVYYRLLQAA